MHHVEQITTVVTAASSYDLITLSTLKTLLGITNTNSDTFLALAISMASTAAADHCKRKFVVETVQDQFWPAKGPWPHVANEGVEKLQLSRWPVSLFAPDGSTPLAPVVTETVGTTTTTLSEGTDYLADAANGFLLRLDQYGRPKNWRFDAVSATYPAGFSVIPLDVVESVSLMVKARFYAQMRDPATRQETAEGVASVSYWLGAGPNVASDMTLEVKAKLDRYRVPSLA